MKKSLFAVFILVIVMSSCGKLGKKNDTLVINKAFDQYITAFTSGVISSHDALQVVFKPDFAATINKSNTKDIFSFSPSIKGTTEWIDDIKLVFKPDKPMSSATSYTGKMNLGKLAKVDKSLSSFPISFMTLTKAFSVNIDPLVCELPSGDSYSLEGDVLTSDIIENKDIESFFSFNLGGKNLQAQWSHGNNNHTFTLTNITRTDKDQKLEINWNGNAAGVKEKGEKTIEVPAKGRFFITGVEVNAGENIIIAFSNLLDPSKEINGLVTLSDDDMYFDISTSVSNNIITIVPNAVSNGDSHLEVQPSITDINGNKLGSTYSETVTYNIEKPGIKAAKTGVITPSSGEISFPFMAANLNAVDITIIKIFENNLPWFLKQYSLGESSAYSSVFEFGRPIYRGKVELNYDVASNPNKYNYFYINLSDYINVEPGILYRVELSMKPSYSLYPCEEDNGELASYERQLNEINRDIDWEGENYYYNTSEYNLYYSFGYNWRDRENPCKVSYYDPSKKLISNILVSDIGMMAKYGSDNSLSVFVTDLLTAKPVPGASIEVYDYQQQLIGNVVTDKQGVAHITCARKPRLAIAKSGNNRNYLSLKDGESLSMSSFDVSGETPVNGIRAFLYTERDVRRPGDTIHLGVIAREFNSTLPENHPVTFELYSPLGQRVDEQTSKLNKEGFVVFTTTTSSNAVTGNYSAKVRIGGATFSKTIKVETVKPNRLKINLTFPSETLGGKNKTIKGTLKTSWLNGSSASGLKSTVEMSFRPITTTFNGYNQYVFDDPVAASYWSSTTKVLDATVDANGQASFSFTPTSDLGAPGMLSAYFLSKVYEKGGDASVSSTSVKYAPYSSFVGINLPSLKSNDRILYTDRDNEVKIATVDKDGKSVDEDVEVIVYKLDYRWWWESGDEYLGAFVSGYREKIAYRDKVKTKGGQATISFNIPKKDWGRYLIRATASSGHSSGKIVLIDWPYEYGIKQGGNDAATMLQINADKEKYNVGEEISLNFPSPGNGMAIITLEGNSSIHDIIEVPTSEGTTTVKLNATATMAPNIYAYVTLLQPYSQTVNDAPIRLYGVIPISVEDKNSRLQPTITMDDNIRPLQPVEIKVNEANKKKMTYTLAVVDEGLLDLTGFKTPDPWTWYYGRQSLGVKTWDLYDNVLGAFGGTISKAFSVGGDEGVVDVTKNMEQRFQAVVKFIGPFTIEAGKTGKHTITLPQYTGSVRVMVVAAGENGQYGNADKQVSVTQPLMILPTAPRVLTPGDEVAIPISVFVNSKSISNVTITASSNDLVSFTTKEENIAVNGETEKDAELHLKVAEKTGMAKITITAKGGAETTSYDLNIEVRSPNPPERRSTTFTVEAGKSYNTTLTPFGIANTSKASVEMFTLPSVNLMNRLSGLTSYPHGCTEQITSAAFPQIYLPSIMGSSLKNTADIKNNVQEALRLLNSRQLGNGSLPLWPGTSYPDDWVTSYAGHFALEAQKAGYSVANTFLNKWKIYQKNQAASWRYQAQYRYTANDQAYRLFTLALAGAADKGAMNRMREIKDLPQLSRWLLAAAYATIGRQEVAMELIDVNNVATDKDLVSYYYGSELRDKEIIAYAMTLIGNNTEAMTLMKEIAERFNSEEWFSTQTTAWGLFTYTTMLKKMGGENGSAKVNYSLNGNSEEIALSGGVIKEFTPNNGDKLAISNTGSSTIFVTITEEGVSSTNDVSERESNINMNVRYVDMDMKTINVSSLSQGTEFMMVVEVANNTIKTFNNMALTQMVPAGWEIENTRLFEGTLPIKESGYDYRDYRDDKIMTYFSLGKGEKKTFVVKLTASYKGTYYLPAVVCEHMYDNSVYSRKAGKNVNITE